MPLTSHRTLVWLQRDISKPQADALSAFKTVLRRCEVTHWFALRFVSRISPCSYNKSGLNKSGAEH
jgi:hypothetical protein